MSVILATSSYNFGLLLINLCKELPYIGNQEIGLLQSREVSALRHHHFVLCCMFEKSS